MDPDGHPPHVPASSAGAAEPDSPGDAGEFSRVFYAFAPAVLRFARRRLADPDAAWDVVTDAFTTAWRHWERRPGDEGTLPWLYAITANAIRDQQRASNRRRRLVARLTSLHRQAEVPDHAERVVFADQVSTAIGRLPAGDREVLRLLAWEQLDDAQSVGLVLGVSTTAARVRIHRARRRLEALLAEPANRPQARSAPDPPAPAAIRQTALSPATSAQKEARHA